MQAKKDASAELRCLFTSGFCNCYQFRINSDVPMNCLGKDLKHRDCQSKEAQVCNPVDATPSETIDWRSKDKISWTVYKLSLKK